MISRVVHCQVKPERVEDFRKTLNEEFLQQIKEQPGFVDVLEGIDTQTGTFVCTTLWENRADVENYEQGLFQEIAEELTPYLSEPPVIETLTVENSSMHQINAGRKKAAA